MTRQNSAQETAHLKTGPANPDLEVAAKRSGEKSPEDGLKPISGKKGGTPPSSSTESRRVMISDEQLLSAFTTMVRARLVDEKAIVLYKQNKCHFQIGVAGHEAVQVAAANVFRPSKDWFYPYYRDMALCAGLGMTNEEFLLNAMNKKDDPNSHGRQMPMHYGHKQLRIVNQSSPTGTQFLQAVGCALGCKMEKVDEVVYVSAGEGTCAQGDFHEAMNWAARDRLPVVFLIQNNEYAISVHVSEQLAGQSVCKIASGYEGCLAMEIDGTDYQASYDALRHAHARALAGEGPTLIEARVPRLQSHSISDNHMKYRTKESIEAEKHRDPISKMAKIIVDRKIATKEELEALKDKLKKEVDAASEWAEIQPECSPDEALEHNYVNPEPWRDVREGEAKGEDVYLVDALNHALDEELARNPKTCVFGQDVAHGKGGVFTVTTGLTAKYGVERVFNTQLAESSIVGVAIGLATRGLKPIAEIQFGDYIWTGMMQIRNELAMMHYRSGGDFSCPAVIRVPVGGYIHGSSYHSQSIDGTFSHFPGLFVVYPSNATDAKGLLKSAIRCEDPVIFMEHKGLYRQVYAKGPEGDADCVVPIGKAKVVKEGRDATIVTWGALVNKSLIAVREMEQQGASIEVIDLRTIVPLDTETIFESVKKTGRVLIAHEDVRFMGFGAEIAAQISDECFTFLDAPVKRVGMKPAAAIAHSQYIENVVLPQTEDVRSALEQLLAF